MDSDDKIKAASSSRLEKQGGLVKTADYRLSLTLSF
jgi:hypothetical protein